MKCNPWRWLWGLGPIIACGWLVLQIERPRLEADLAARVKEALGRHGIAWASVAFNGRDGVLGGRASEEAEPDKALRLVADTWGVRVIESTASVLETVQSLARQAERRDNRIRLVGFVPNDKARRDVIGMVKANFPTLDIEDRLRVARGAPDLDLWLSGVGFGLKQLALLKSGQVVLEQTKLTVDGEAADVGSYRMIRKALTLGLPQGIALKREGVGPPVARPFLWTVRLNREQLELTGTVPGDSFREALLMQAKRAFPKRQIVDAMEPASGAPKGFEPLALMVLQELAKLEDGTAEIRDVAFGITGMAESQAKAEAVRAALRQGLPSSFRMTEQIRHPEPPVTTAKATEPRATETAGALKLPPTEDETRRQHDEEARLKAERDQISQAKAAAIRQVEEARRKADIEQQSRLVAETEARRKLAEEARLRTDDEARRKEAEIAQRLKAEADRQARLREETEAGLKRQREARLQAEADERLRSEAAARQARESEARARTPTAALQGRATGEGTVPRSADGAAGACETALRTISREGVLQFKRASATLTSESFPMLTRVAEAANRCPNVTIEIGGHTDSDGTPERNTRLAMKRSRAVADFLVKAGVPAERLNAVGYGETRSVTPNDTPENKAVNRRIEFSVKVN